MTSKSKKNKKASKKEMINKKGSEKEGSDMDVFTEKPSSPAEKSRSNERTTAQTNNTSANRSSKTNSSQKIIDDKKDISADEPKKELVNSQNIPVTQTVPAADLNKTEQTVVESRSKKYPVEFLLQLRDLPQCKKPVKFLSNLQHTLYEDQSNRSANTMNRGPSGYNFMPQFVAPGRGSMSLPARKSQQGRLKNDRPTPIHVSLSLREDVPLRHSKDAWKPARLNSDVRNLSSDEKKTQELYKTVTGILNKLTPEKFETLVEKIRSLPIDNVPRLQGVIDLIFDKAIDEPGFCKWYAEMCKVMQTVEISEKDSKASFRIFLINKCQQQFERDKAEELDVIKKQEEIQTCTDPEKKKELQLLFEETERKVRRKSVGNCRFIGELFKLQMLTAKIMLRCISKLLGSIDEESLECLCKLLTTIGKDLENKVSGNSSSKRELDQYFDKMLDLSENKKYKVSSRIRFMLQDVIDLRRNNWVPRREADNPKKIDQINTELERKEHEIKMMNMQPPRRQDDYYNNRNRDFKKGSRTGSQNEDEWKTVVKSSYKMNYKFDTNKLAGIGVATHDLQPDSLGPADGFKKWSHGVAANKPGEKKMMPYSSLQPTMTSSNSYRNLSNKVTPSSSMEKPKPYPGREDEAGKISRSGSAQNIHPSSRESSVPRQVPSRNASQNASQSSAPPTLTDDQLTRACATIYQEFDSNNDLKDSLEAFQERFNPKQVPEAVKKMVSHMIENKPVAAPSCGRLLANLIKRGTITKEHFIDALKFLVEISEDLIIDCPKLWVFLADAANPLIAEDCLQISELRTIFPGSPLLNHVSNKPVSRNSGASEDKDSILKKSLLECLNEETSDDVVKWIDENFENSRNSPKLVHKLTTTICKIVYDEWRKSGSEKVDDSPVIEELMKKYQKFFKLYIENKGELEMQCLMAVHEFIDKADYPQGLLMKLFEFFYDYKLISYDSYIQWKNTDVSCDRHRIGVALKSLNSFFEFIQEEQTGEDCE